MTLIRKYRTWRRSVVNRRTRLPAASHRNLITERGLGTDIKFQAYLYQRTGPGYANDTAYAAAVSVWLEEGHDPTLLRNAVIAGLSAAELQAHLDGTTLIDPPTVAMLAALRPDLDIAVKIDWNTKGGGSSVNLVVQPPTV